MRQYLDMMKEIYENGIDHPDRTGVGRRSIFGRQLRFKMKDGFPLVTTRKIFTKAIIEEMLWFIRGDNKSTSLEAKNVNIWKAWSISEESIADFAKRFSKGDEDIQAAVTAAISEEMLGSIGPMYGYMWRNAPQSSVHGWWPKIAVEDIPKDKYKLYSEEYDEIVFLQKDQELPTREQYAQHRYRETVDQLNELLINLRDRPYSSRLIVSAWIPEAVPFENLSPQDNVMMGKGALAPCHAMFQCFVSAPEVEGGKKRLSLMMTIRSSDFAIGNPFNTAQYALLLAMLAHVTDMEPYEFILSGGDIHLYADQLPLIEEQLSREPLKLPTLWLNPEVKSLYDFTSEDIAILDYKCHPAIKYPVAV